MTGAQHTAAQALMAAGQALTGPLHQTHTQHSRCSGFEFKTQVRPKTWTMVTTKSSALNNAQTKWQCNADLNLCKAVVPIVRGGSCGVTVCSGGRSRQHALSMHLPQ